MMWDAIKILLSFYEFCENSVLSHLRRGGELGHVVEKSE